MDVIMVLIEHKALGTNLLKLLSQCSRFLNSRCRIEINRHNYLKQKYGAKFATRLWKRLIKNDLYYSRPIPKYIKSSELAFSNNLLCMLATNEIKLKFCDTPAVLTGINLIMRDRVPFYYAVLWSDCVISSGFVVETDYTRLSDALETIGEFSTMTNRHIVKLDVPLDINPLPIVAPLSHYIRLLITPEDIIEITPEGIEHRMEPDVDFCLEFINGVLINYSIVTSQFDVKLNLDAKKSIYTSSMLVKA